MYRKQMIKSKTIRLPFVAGLLALAIAGCGSSSHASTHSGTQLNANTVVARVGATPVPAATISHWVATLIRGDYYAVMHHKAPTGLATNPPDYATCAGAAKAIPLPRGQSATHLSSTQLEAKCRQLYQSVKSEALSYVLSVLWSIGQGAERGYHATDSDISARITELKTTEYPKPGQFETYLDEKGWSPADLRFIVKRDVVEGKLLHGLEHEAGRRGVSLERLLESNVIRWKLKTSCQPGYIVQQCRQFTASKPEPAPAKLFEELAQGAH